MNDQNRTSTNYSSLCRRVLIVTAKQPVIPLLPMANGMTIVSDLTGAGYPFDLISYERFIHLKFDETDNHDVIFLNGPAWPLETKNIAAKCREAIECDRKLFINGDLPYVQYDEKGQETSKIMFSQELFNLRCKDQLCYGKARMPQEFQKDPDITRTRCFPHRTNTFIFSKSPEFKITLGRHIVGFLTSTGGAISGSSDYLLNLLDYGKITSYFRYGRPEIIGFANDRIDGNPIVSIEVHCDSTSNLNSVDTLENLTKRFNIPLSCLLVRSRLTQESIERWQKAAKNPFILIGSHSSTHPKKWPEVDDFYEETTGALKKQKQSIPETGNYFNFSGWMNPTTEQIDQLFQSDTIFGAQGKGARMLGLPFSKPWQTYRNMKLKRLAWKVLNHLLPPTEIQLMPTCPEWFFALAQSEKTPYCLSHTLWGDFKAYKNNRNYTKIVKKGYRENIKYGLYSYGYIHDYALDKSIKKVQTQGVPLQDQIVDALEFLASQKVMFIATETLIRRLRDFICGGICCEALPDDSLKVTVYRDASLINQVKIQSRNQQTPAASGDCVLGQKLIGRMLYVELKPEVKSTFYVKFET